MTFTVNGRFLSRPMTGVDRVAENILLRMDAQWPVENLGRYKVAVPRETQRSITLQNGDMVRIGHRSGLAWEQLDLPSACKADLIFNPCNTAPLRHKNNIVTIHDANVMDYPASYSRGFRAWYKLLLPRIARRAKAVITVSEFSADRLLHHGVVNTRPIVISNGCDHLEERAQSQTKRNGSVLFVGSPAAHKNLDMFIKLAAEFEGRDVPFLVAGARSDSVFSHSGTSAPLPKNMKFLGRVTEQQLVDLYQSAQVLLFPSFVEGFGLTPLEAQSFGCPVISSNREPMTELLSDSVLYADPDDLADWETELNSLLSSDQAWANLSQGGLENAKRFTWANAAQQYLSVIVDEIAADSRQTAYAPSVPKVSAV